VAEPIFYCPIQTRRRYFPSNLIEYLARTSNNTPLSTTMIGDLCNLFLPLVVHSSLIPRLDMRNAHKFPSGIKTQEQLSIMTTSSVPGRNGAKSAQRVIEVQTRRKYLEICSQPQHTDNRDHQTPLYAPSSWQFNHLISSFLQILTQKRSLCFVLQQSWRTTNNPARPVLPKQLKRPTQR
jgi:hypothetical protein